MQLFIRGQGRGDFSTQRERVTWRLSRRLALRDCSVGATSQGSWELPEAERDKEHMIPLSFQEEQGLGTSGVQTSSFQNCERINIYCFKTEFTVICYSSLRKLPYWDNGTLGLWNRFGICVYVTNSNTFPKYQLKSKVKSMQVEVPIVFLQFQFKPSGACLTFLEHTHKPEHQALAPSGVSM